MHHWIRDEQQLSATEKLVLMVIESWQFRGHMTGVSQPVIARGCSLSVRAVQKAIQSIEGKGFPVVARCSSKGDATHYLVKQRQKLMFSPSNSPDFSDARSRPGTQPPGGAAVAQPVQNSVQNSFPKHPPYEPRSPVPPLGANHVRTLSVSTSETTKSKSRAEVRPHGPPPPGKPLKTEAEQRRIVAAIQRREQQEREVSSELQVGAPPLVQRLLRHFATRLGEPPSPLALSDAQIEARRRELLAQKEQILSKAAGA